MCIQPTNAMDPTQLNRITLFGFLWVDRFRWILIFFFKLELGWVWIDKILNSSNLTQLTIIIVFFFFLIYFSILKVNFDEIMMA